MFDDVKNYLDVEAKRRFRPSDAAQFVITLYAFLGTLLIKIKYLGCGGWQWKMWIDFVFFGSIIWLAYLLILTVGKYRNPNLNFFFKILDLVFFAFLLAMWIWLVVIFAKKQFLGCSDPTDMFGIIFLVFGAIVLLLFAFGILGWIWTKLRPNDSPHLAAFYNDNVDFNPYQ